MTSTLSLDRLRALRMIAQLLAPSAALERPDSIVGTAKHMLASQAQLRKSGVQTIDIRAQSTGAAEAMRTSELIRSWSQRGTHQLLAAEDVRWMTLLCSPRIIAASAKRRKNIGLDDAAFHRAEAILREHAHTPVPRRRAYELFTSVDVDPGEGRGQHILRHLGGAGEIVQGPPAENEDTFVLLDVVCKNSRELSGDAALLEMTSRYFHSRGVATIKDVQWWTGLMVGDVKKGITLAEEAGKIVPVAGPKGEVMWMPTWADSVTDKEATTALDTELFLPAFDEYLLSYSDRTHVMDPAHLFTIGPGKNGIFKAFRLIRGEALPVA